MIRSCARVVSQNKILLAIPQKQFPFIVREFAEVSKQPKKVVKKGGPTKKGKDDEGNKNDDMIHKFVDSVNEVVKIKHNFTDEEKREHYRIGREYNRQRMIEHNKLNKDLCTKMWLQSEAQDALPAELLEHALVIDNTPPPQDRPWPIFMTPPVPGLNLKDMEEEEADISHGDIRTDRYSGQSEKTEY